MGVMDPYRRSEGDAALHGIDLGPDPNLWEDVPTKRLYYVGEVSDAIGAILDHLNCTLQSRIEPGKGKVWRLAAKP